MTKRKTSALRQKDTRYAKKNQNYESQAFYMNESKTINEYEYLDNIYCLGVPDKQYDAYPMIQIEDMMWNEYPVFY